MPHKSEFATRASPRRIAIDGTVGFCDTGHATEAHNDKPLAPAPEQVASGLQGTPQAESEPMLSACAKPSLSSVEVHWLWNETVRRLRTLQERAREGRQVDEASEFARWVRFSGLMAIFTAFKAPEPLQVSPEVVDALIEGIGVDCDAFWKNDQRGQWVARSEVEQINLRLASLARVVSEMVSNAKQESATIKDAKGIPGLLLECPGRERRERDRAKREPPRR